MIANCSLSLESIQLSKRYENFVSNTINGAGTLIIFNFIVRGLTAPQDAQRGHGFRGVCVVAP